MAEAVTRVEAAEHAARRALDSLSHPACVSDLLEDALAELQSALAHATEECRCAAESLAPAVRTRDELSRVATGRAAARAQLLRATAAASAALGGVAHCSPANVARVLQKLSEGVSVARDARVERSLVEAAELLSRDLEEAEDHRAHARLRLRAATARA